MSITPGKAERENLCRLLEIARDEDLGAGDVTGAILPRGATAHGRFVARQDLVVCGAALLGEIVSAYDPSMTVTPHAEEGAFASAGDVLAECAGRARAVLSAERVALNFLQRLSGIASWTRRYVEAVAGMEAVVCDTRKTTPGWRSLEKYAVRCGGGCNHRMGLYDAVLVKDNHLAMLAAADPKMALSGLGDRLTEARTRLGEGGFVEVEVDTLEQLAEAMKLPVDVVLLDNMPPDALREAVRMRDEAGRGDAVALEASGGVTLETVRAVAEAGVDRIAVGALTHSAPAVDIALEVDLD
ncbi:MAG: carboxylating nicotinate-nucleotide diphosphorylase [Phycisphaerae bacterium]|jgi:nicotinate-nucleotide pyrophosphorylase (carboxylating)|nr:carboxylating nicotinate-nucleotide diphosphorylase [Phycisphaerae bacterium]